MNARNNGVMIGRAARDPHREVNGDGSEKWFLTVAVQDNFKSKDGSYRTNYLPVEGMVSANHASADKHGAWPNIHKGDRIAVGYHLKMEQYEKNGQTEYKLKVIVDDISLEEPKSVTSARQAKNQADAAAQAEAPVGADEADGEGMPFDA